MKKQQEVDIELKPTCAPQFMRIADQMGMNFVSVVVAWLVHLIALLALAEKYSHVLI